MMLQRLLLLVIILSIVGCIATELKPHLIYRAEIDTVNIDRVESVLEGIAKSYNLQFEKRIDKEQLKHISKGMDAFSVFFLLNKNAILHVGNSGFGDVVFLSAYDYGEMPIQDLEELSAEVLTTLKNEFGIEFKSERGR